MAINKRKVLEAARKYAQKGAQAKALREFEKLLKLDPRDARLRLEVGDSHRRWGNTAEAIDTYKKVAEQYTKEGFDARAVAVYKQIHNLAPTAYETYEPLADLYQRMGLSSEAILTLQTSADGYHKQGKKKEALDLLRKMATLDPTNTTSRIKVADLLRHEELYTEAIGEYAEAAVELERQGDREGAVSAYQRILDIEPGRLATLLLFSRNLLERGLADRAEPAVKRLLAAAPDEPDRYEMMATVYRLQRRDDELVETYRNLAELYRERGDEDQAREILQRFVPVTEFDATAGIDEDLAFGNITSATELGESGSFDAGSTLGGTELTGLANQPGFESLKSIQPPAPLRAEDFLPPPDIGDDDNFLLDFDDSESPLELEVAIAPPTPSAPKARAPAAPVAESTADVDPQADPEQLLAEANVYLRYGKREQAVANLEALVARDRNHRLALEKLGEAYAAGQEPARAVEMWLRAARLADAEEDDAAVALLRDRISVLDPVAALGIGTAETGETTIDAPAAPVLRAFEGEATMIDLDAIDTSGGAGEAREFELDDIEIDIDDSAFGDSPPGADAGAPDEVGIPSDAAPRAQADAQDDGPGGSSAVAQQIGEDLEEADFYMKQGLPDEAATIYRRVLSIAPNHPHALVRLGEVAALRGEDPASAQTGSAPKNAAPDFEQEKPEWKETIAGPDASDLAAPALEPGAVAAPPAIPTAPASRADRHASLEDELARDFLAEVSGRAPGDTADAATQAGPPPFEAGENSAFTGAPESDADAGSAGFAPAAGPPETSEVAAPLASPDDSFTSDPVDLGEAPELSLPPAVATGADGSDEVSFDLAAELSGVFDDDSSGRTQNGVGDTDDGFEAVFSAFKAGVSRTLTEHDHDAHFDLGIAYREMGLVEDAKNEFRATMRNPAREIECRHMLGLCCAELGEHEQAVAEFDRIVAAERASAEQRLSAQFELGGAWQALGDSDRARAAYQAVMAVDPLFCEVALRLAALDDPVKPEVETHANDELESFEDFLADSDADDAADAGDSERDPDTAEYESFDDFLADDIEAESDVDAGRSIPDVAPVPIAELPAAAEPDFEPEPANEPLLQPLRKRKKISFV